jgi:hypothetical protein
MTQTVICEFSEPVFDGNFVYLRKCSLQPVLCPSVGWKTEFPKCDLRKREMLTSSKNDVSETVPCTL